MHKDLKKKEPYGSLLPTSFVAVEGCGQDSKHSDTVP